jgi:hypothetical protein
LLLGLAGLLLFLVFLVLRFASLLLLLFLVFLLLVLSLFVCRPAFAGIGPVSIGPVWIGCLCFPGSCSADFAAGSWFLSWS